MSDQLKSDLTEFVSFASGLKGDEKGESQSFLDHFFRALGHAGVIEAGATFEFRVAKKPGSPQLELITGNGTVPRSKGGKKFADLLWPDRVLIEMKSRGEKLEKYYDQAFDYWSHIVPKRPPYVILCNFDEFWIYDFNTQLFDPVDRIPLSKVAESWRAFAFLLPHKQEPKFDNNRVDVTRRAADLMARVFRELTIRGENRERAQRFILQLLVAMVAEDIRLLPSDIVTDLLYESSEKGASSYDLFGGLFRQMASVEPARGGRFQDVRYFNGGLFAVVDPIELKRAEVYALYEAAAHNDWSQVRPEIFGTLFQDSMDKEERHAFGAHFTSEFDIRKVVGPTIVRPWRNRIDAAGKNIGQLRKALADLRQFRVLDPACGSGNFLFIAYREIKRLERDILLRLRQVSKREPLESAISLHQFFGIDIIPFAVELAKVTLMLAKELEVIEAQKLAETDQLLIDEKPLPLDNLDKNIICADALFTEWPKADAIIGNPPYLGSRYVAQEHGYEYARKVHARFPEIPKMADFCTHWFRLAHAALPPGGRAGLVGTNTVRQNESREASLDYIVENGGVITEAVSSEKWSGEAAVSVSIVNWVKGCATGKKTIHTQVGDAVDSPWRIEELDSIPASLSSALDVSGAPPLTANQEPKVVFVGQYPFHEGFMMEPEEAQRWLAADPSLRDVLFPYMTGQDLLELGRPSRWIIDFGQNDIFYARRFARALERIEERVMPDVLAHAEDEKRKTGKISTRWTRVADRWWQFRDYQPGTMAAISSVPRYVAISRVTKRPIFEFVSSAIHPDNALVVFPFADDYSFGILQSGIHFDWFKARCSTLEGRFRYTSDTVFDTFPWPQSPAKTVIAEVATAAVALRVLRREIMGKLGYSLRELYRTLEEPGANPLREAHDQLDSAVREAYAMPANADPLAFLLALNLTLARKEEVNEKITPPGLPLPKSERVRFTTQDCIQLPSDELMAFTNQAREGVEKTRAEARQMTPWEIQEQIRRNAS
jgi:SAM-dependent methyltransferase